MFIIGNENLSKYILQHISTNQYYIILNCFYNRCIALLPNKINKNNSVGPLPKTDNLPFFDDSQRIVYI
jgi:hypothetical protein